MTLSVLPRPARRLCGVLSLAVALLFLATATGCSDEDGTEGPVADSTMVQLFIDLHLLRARSTFRESQEIPDSMRAVRDTIFARRGITQRELETMMNLYAGNPDRYQEMYTAVVDSLNAMRVELSRAERDTSILKSLIENPPHGALPPK